MAKRRVVLAGFLAACLLSGCHTALAREAPLGEPKAMAGMRSMGRGLASLATSDPADMPYLRALWAVCAMIDVGPSLAYDLCVLPRDLIAALLEREPS